MDGRLSDTSTHLIVGKAQMTVNRGYPHSSSQA